MFLCRGRSKIKKLQQIKFSITLVIHFKYFYKHLFFTKNYIIKKKC